MVGYPKDVEEVYCGDNKAFFQTAKAGTIVVDMTTSEPTLSKKTILNIAKEKGIHSIDAPVIWW